jgi:hypothetical protein
MRSANRAVTTVLFSVSPSQSPTGTLVPSVVMTRATTAHEPATSSPSIMSTATSRSERFRAINSPMALVVAATKRLEMADLDMDFERCLELRSDRLGHVSVASGGHPGQHALDDEGVEQIGRAERLPGVEPDFFPGAAASPRPLGGDLAPPEHDRTLRVAVPVSDTLLGAGFWSASHRSLRSVRPPSSGRITTSPVADANASRPSLIAPATSARATVASSGRSARRAASSTCATLTTGSFFFIGGPLSGWFFGLVS